MWFSTSRVTRQLPNHPLYPNIDWNKVEGGLYAIVDPMDSGGVLYLSEKEYKIQIRVSVSQDSTLSVLARPGDSKLASPTSTPKPNQNSPIKVELGLAEVRRTSSALVPKKFSFLGWYASRQGYASGESLVTVTGESLLSLLLHWGLDLDLRAGGQLEPQPALKTALVELGKKFATILLTRGTTSLVSKMKNTLFFTNRWLGGVKNTDPFLLGEPVGLARSGLPRILPLYMRRGLGSKNPRMIRVVLSLLKAYSAFEAPHKDSDLVSVTDPCPPLDQFTLKQFGLFCANVFWPKVIRKYAEESGKVWVLKPKLCADPNDKPFHPSRGGPNHSVGVLGAPMDALAWAACPINYPLEWAAHVGDVKTSSLFASVLEKTERARDLQRESPVKDPFVRLGRRVKRWDLLREKDVGRLAFLPEPAGKVRAIAMADYWTQRLMKPVHDWMMSVLSVLPTDATFNQERGLQTYVEETKGVNTHSSIDLKSATDMIPIDLYHAVLSPAWGEKTSNLWIGLMTDRWFRIPKGSEENSPLVIPELRGTVVQYNRGQPMGALSSWASMALVHHALELFSAHRAGLDPTCFTAYRVLGDDNVTGNESVAKCYREVCERLQVPISNSKTLEGKLFIFASQIYLEGQNYSPMSLKEEMSIKTSHQRLEMALRANSRGWLGDKPTTAKLLRHLLRRRDYLRTYQEFKKGKLGRVAQAALISAFALLGHSVERLGVGGSSVVPFLLSFENKVRALGGDETHLDSSTRAKLDDIESILAIAIARRAMAKLREDILAVKLAARRWNGWKSLVPTYGFPDRANEFGELVFHEWDTECPPRTKPDKVPDKVSWISFAQAVMPVLEDYYGYWFKRLPVEAPRQKTLSEQIAQMNSSTKSPQKRLERAIRLSRQFWKRYITDIGRAVRGQVGTVAGQAYTIGTKDKGEPGTPGVVNRPLGDPRILEDMTKISVQANALFSELVRGTEDGGPQPNALNKVRDLLELMTRVPQLETLESLESLIPERTPKALRDISTWTKTVRSYSVLLNHVDLFRDFSVLDIPVTGMDEGEEALRSMTREALLSVTRKDSVSPFAAKGPKS